MLPIVNESIPYKEVALTEIATLAPKLAAFIEYWAQNQASCSKSLLNLKRRDERLPLVSTQELAELQLGETINTGLRTRYFNFKYPLMDALTKSLSALFSEYQFSSTGHFWYPAGGYMDWHTNHKSPGIRLYVVYADKDRASFFRYQDPMSKEIVTSWDKKGWNVRLFFTSLAQPLWHCVNSSCNRLSLGWCLTPHNEDVR